MPTMITPFYKVDLSNINFEKILTLALNVKLRKIEEADESELLILLSKLTKNRLVGTSKIMMILNPEIYPIFDSRVIISWNNIFKEKIRDISTKTSPDKAIKNYRIYKQKVAEIASLNKVSIRQVEFLFYTYGKKLSKKKRPVVNKNQ